MRMVFLPVEGAAEVVEVTGLREMAAKIGATMVERVRVAEDVAMAVDEDGRYTDKRVNVPASLLYGMHRHGTPVVGAVLVGVEAMSMDGVDWVDHPDVADRVLRLLADRIREAVKVG